MILVQSTPNKQTKTRVIVLSAILGLLIIGATIVMSAVRQHNQDIADKAAFAKLATDHKKHAMAARANHIRRLAWQQTHPREFTAQKEHERLVIAEQQRVASGKRLHATKVAAYAANHTPCKEFGSALSIAASAGVLGYRCEGVAKSGYLIHVKISNEAWSPIDYDTRLQIAKNLWNLCVNATQVTSADSCHVRLDGEAGEDLGGSNPFAGSIIDVSKD